MQRTISSNPVNKFFLMALAIIAFASINLQAQTSNEKPVATERVGVDTVSDVFETIGNNYLKK